MGEVLPFRARAPRTPAPSAERDLITAAVICADLVEAVVALIDDPEVLAAVRAARDELDNAIDDALDAAR